MGKSQKGGAFERQTCRDLSEWLSEGKRDDLLWRSSMSGGRATVRGRKGKTTAGHYGDVAATCPQGEPLTRAFAIELKRGYGSFPTARPDCLMDRPNGCGQQVFEAFVQQAESAREASGAFGWWLVYQRDKRNAVLFTERRVEKKLKALGAFTFRPSVRLTLEAQLRFELTENKKLTRVWYPQYRLVGFDFQEFLDLVPPNVVRRIAKENK